MTTPAKTGRKRGNNEGSIYQRKDGLWCAQASLPDGSRKYLYGKTRAEVAKKLTAAQRDVQQGIPLPSGRLTLGAFLTDWLENTVKPSVRPRTYQSYEGVVRLHLLPALGKVLLADVTPSRIQTLMNAKLAEGLNPRTVTYIRDVLSHALNQAVRWNMLPRNVAPLVKAPKAVKREMTVFTPEQARAFLDAVRGDRLEALYTVALALGLRQGEALGLTWADVDFDAGTITVKHQLQRIAGKLTLTEPKSRASRRTIQAPAVVLDALRQHRRRQLEERLALGGDWQDSGLVFTTAKGTPLDDSNLRRLFLAALRTAGLPRLRFHDLRHSAASLLLAQGVPARMIMELLGHSQITLTLGTYSHILPQLSRETAEKMNAILTGSGLG